jgi:DNA repair protein RecO (recombination protein O)
MANKQTTRQPIEYLKTEGIVIKYTNYNDNDRIITVFSPEYRKLSILAKNCRSNKSKNLAAVQLFALSQFSLTKRVNFNFIKEAELTQNFFIIINDFERYTVASYFNELIYVGTTENQTQEDVFALYLKSLYFIMLSTIAIEDVFIYFEIHLMRALGFVLQVNACQLCESNEPIEWFDTSNDMFLCQGCANGKSNVIPVQQGTVKTIKKLLECDYNIIGILKMSKQVQREINQIASSHASGCLSNNFKARELVNQFLFKA